MSQVLVREDHPGGGSRAARAGQAVPERRAGGPLRILMSSYRSSPTTGGQGVYLRHLTRALLDLGHSVDVISGPPYPDLPPGAGLIRLPSLDLYASAAPMRALRWPMLRSRVDFGEWLSHNSGGFPEPYTFGERLATYMRGRTHLYDILHDNQTLTPGLLRVRALGLPLLSTVHHPITVDRRLDIAHAPGLGHRLLKRRWYAFVPMQVRVARRLERLLVVSHSARRDIAREFGIPAPRLHLIRHGVDQDRFRPLPGIVRKQQLVATASADVPLKGLRYLLQAYARLLPRYPDLDLVVVSRPRTAQAIRTLAELGLGDRVRFVWDLDEESIVRLYAQSAIAVSPSLYEGFGFPAVEAMACGVPVVASDGGALPEVVGDAGVIVPRANACALAQAIGGLLDNPARRAALGEAGRRRVARQFQWLDAGRRTVALYTDMLSNADRGPARAGS